MRIPRSTIITIALSLIAAPAMAEHCPAVDAEADAIEAMRDSDPQGGVNRGEALLEQLIRAHDCPVEEAQLHGAIGANLILLGHHLDARDRYRQALDRGGEALHGSDRAKFLRGLGLAHYDLGDFEAAVTHYVASLEASEAVGDPLEAAKTAGNIGILYTTLGQVERARQYQERALDLFTAADFRIGIAGTLVNLGSLVARQARDARAQGLADEERALNEQLREYNLRALRIFDELGNRRGVAYAAANVGLAWDYLGEPARALEYHEQALAVRQELGDAHGTINSLVTIADTYIVLGRHAEAEAALDEAHGMLPDDNPTLELTVMEPRARLAEARGDYAAALSYQRRIGSLRSDIAVTDHRTRVAEIETRYQSEHLRRQVTSLEYDQALADEQLRRQQLRTVAATVIALLLFALIAALYARYRLKVHSQLALEKAARTDELTGLANRRHMRERIEYEIQRARRSARPFSVGIIDLDEFKQVNDRYGHAAGDKALVTVVARLQNMLRKQDTLARWGGDELLLLLPETEEQGAMALARKIVAHFDTHAVTVDDHKHRITMTIGIAQYWPGMELDQCLQCADDALYEGKRAGRNQARANRP